MAKESRQSRSPNRAGDTEQTKVRAGGSEPVRQQPIRDDSRFRAVGSILVMILAAVFLAVPVFWGLAYVLLGTGVIGEGVTPPAWDWTIAILLVFIAAVAIILYVTVFRHTSDQSELQ